MVKVFNEQQALRIVMKPGQLIFDISHICVAWAISELGNRDHRAIWSNRRLQHTYPVGGKALFLRLFGPLFFGLFIGRKMVLGVKLQFSTHGKTVDTGPGAFAAGLISAVFIGAAIAFYFAKIFSIMIFCGLIEQALAIRRSDPELVWNFRAQNLYIEPGQCFCSG